MSAVDEEGRTEPPLASDELGTLLGFLDYHRATLAWKTSGLDSASLNTRLSPSTMTLGGLLKHLAWVEDLWFSCRLHGNEPADAWASVDWDSDPDWEWNSASDNTPDELREFWSSAVDASRVHMELALADGGLDRLIAVPRRNGERASLRWVLVHMIEEYARHNGHADLLRENVDGSTGE
ncbi:MAG: DinB family protein [Cryobacterium sp.]|nr:DinB family protein [Cryobacterium sp.]